MSLVARELHEDIPTQGTTELVAFPVAEEEEEDDDDEDDDEDEPLLELPPLSPLSLMSRTTLRLSKSRDVNLTFL